MSIRPPRAVRLLPALLLLGAGPLAGCSSSGVPQPASSPSTTGVAYPYPTTDVPADQQVQWQFGWLRVEGCEENPSELPRGKVQLTVEFLDEFGVDRGTELGARLYHDNQALQVMTSDSTGIVTGWNMHPGRSIVDIVLDPATCAQWATQKTHPPFRIIAATP